MALYKDLNWWSTEPAKLEDEIDKYETPWATRKVAVYCLLFALAVGFLAGAYQLGDSELTDYIPDAIVIAVLVPFMWLGFKWSFIGSMLYWTTAKAFHVYTLLTLPHPNGMLLVVILLWWAAFMRPMWVAFRVEQVKTRKGLQ